MTYEKKNGLVKNLIPGAVMSTHCEITEDENGLTLDFWKLVNTLKCLYGQGEVETSSEGNTLKLHIRKKEEM